jgi:hypothetical protein
MVYDDVFKEIYDPNKHMGLYKEEDAPIARMNHMKRRATVKRRKRMKLLFRGFGKQA